MKRLVKSIALMVAVLAPSFAKAQDKVEATLKADIVNSYVWRGQNLGSGAIQPELGISWKGLSLGAWASYGFINKDDTKELDIELGYQTGGFNVGLTDYFCSAGSGDCPDKYFRFKSGGKGPQVHVLEGNVGYDFGFMAVNWYTNIAGDDDYSSYFDFNVPFKLGIDWEFNAGFVPYKTVYYANDKFTCTNLSLKASKEIPVTEKFSIPVFGQLSANPDNGKFYFAFGLTLGI